MRREKDQTRSSWDGTALDLGYLDYLGYLGYLGCLGCMGCRRCMRCRRAGCSAVPLAQPRQPLLLLSGLDAFLLPLWVTKGRDPNDETPSA